jgi:hypothetical protein
MRGMRSDRVTWRLVRLRWAAAVDLVIYIGFFPVVVGYKSRKRRIASAKHELHYRWVGHANSVVSRSLRLVAVDIVAISFYLAAAASDLVFPVISLGCL